MTPPIIPGEVTGPDDVIVCNEGRARVTVTVVNTGDRPVQVGSHFHFAETNPALSFDRAAARGFRLDIAAGTSVRFEPGVERDVPLCAFGGARYIAGFRGEVGGPLDG
jgi:urease subunit beta